ncbi:S41 family peptidase [Flavitalea sp. BT771]|uniref:S41 family peptidase n=1 Tax=Flavitalea sp. BT771 TaxID=3063329 RepID=UPI0026E34C20|nr:S41 family peptidase [Flavitalea sp. BT771]MDO6432709.1 S41 family peptidase [Flavitalea sp. BT771]MDV6222015.1 S41 family peptidase [Flavitalea sp. BT771]
MRALFLILLFTLSAIQKNYSQTCSCESNFQWVKATFEANDAGFKYIINKKGKDAYEIHNRLYLDKIKHLPNDRSCADAINSWIRFFRNGHIGINYLKEDVPAKPIKLEKFGPNYNDFMQYLDRKNNNDTLEGVWTINGYKIGIKKRSIDYVGFVLESPNKAWEANEIKIVFNDKGGSYYAGDKTEEKVTSVKRIGNTYLKLGEATLHKVYPATKEDEKVEKGYAQLHVKKPFFEKLNETTAYLRIPDFEITEKPLIDSVIAKNRDIILRTQNLIIDVRNNPGGSDATYEQLIPFLYTNPIRIVGTAFLSTKLNNQRMLELSNNMDFDEASRKTFRKYYDQLDQSPGEFVNLSEEKVDIEKRDKILPYPKNIGIIIHQGNGSTTEQFLLLAKQSKKVKLFGKTTHGMLDISNVNIIPSPCNDFELYYGLSKSFRIPDFAIDDIGLQPDYFIDSTVPEYGWVDHVNKILNAEN